MEHETGQDRPMSRPGEHRQTRNTGKGKNFKRSDTERAGGKKGENPKQPTEPDNNSKHKNVSTEPQKTSAKPTPKGTEQQRQGSSRQKSTNEPSNGQPMHWGILMKTLEEAGMSKELKDKLSEFYRSKKPAPTGTVDKNTKQLANTIFRLFQLKRHLANWKIMPTGLARRVDDFVKNLHPPCRDDTLSNAYKLVTTTFKADIVASTLRHLDVEREKAEVQLCHWQGSTLEIAINMAASRIKRTYAGRMDNASLDAYLEQVTLLIGREDCITVDSEDSDLSFDFDDLEPDTPVAPHDRSDTPPGAEDGGEGLKASPPPPTKEAKTKPATTETVTEQQEAQPSTSTAKPLYSVIAANKAILKPITQVITAQVHSPPGARTADIALAKGKGNEPPRAADANVNRTPTRVAETEPPLTTTETPDSQIITVDLVTPPAAMTTTDASASPDITVIEDTPPASKKTAVAKKRPKPQQSVTARAGAKLSRKRPASPEQPSSQTRPTKKAETSSEVRLTVAPCKNNVIFPTAQIRDTMTICKYRKFERILIVGGIETKFWKDMSLPVEWKVLSFPTFSIEELAEMIIRSETTIPKEVEKIVLGTHWTKADNITGYVAMGEKLKRCKEVFGDRFVVMDPPKHPADPVTGTEHMEFVGTIIEAVGQKSVVGAARHQVEACDNEPYVHSMTKVQARCLLTFLYKSQ